MRGSEGQDPLRGEHAVPEVTCGGRYRYCAPQGLTLPCLPAEPRPACGPVSLDVGAQGWVRAPVRRARGPPAYLRLQTLDALFLLFQPPEVLGYGVHPAAETGGHGVLASGQPPHPPLSPATQALWGGVGCLPFPIIPRSGYRALLSSVGARWGRVTVSKSGGQGQTGAVGLKGPLGWTILGGSRAKRTPPVSVLLPLSASASPAQNCDWQAGATPGFKAVRCPALMVPQVPEGISQPLAPHSGSSLPSAGPSPALPAPLGGPWGTQPWSPGRGLWGPPHSPCAPVGGFSQHLLLAVLPLLLQPAQVVLLLNRLPGDHLLVQGLRQVSLWEDQAATGLAGARPALVRGGGGVPGQAPCGTWPQKPRPPRGPPPALHIAADGPGV